MGLTFLGTRRERSETGRVPCLYAGQRRAHRRDISQRDRLHPPTQPTCIRRQRWIFPSISCTLSICSSPPTVKQPPLGSVGIPLARWPVDRELHPMTLRLEVAIHRSAPAAWSISISSNALAPRTSKPLVRKLTTEQKTYRKTLHTPQQSSPSLPRLARLRDSSD